MCASPSCILQILSSVLTTKTSSSLLIQLYALLIYWRSFSTHMKSRCNVQIEHHVSIFMSSKISRISQELCNTAESCRSYGFSTLYDSQIQIKSMLKEFYITVTCITLQAQMNSQSSVKYYTICHLNFRDIWCNINKFKKSLL